MIFIEQKEKKEYVNLNNAKEYAGCIIQSLTTDDLYIVPLYLNEDRQEKGEIIKLNDGRTCFLHNDNNFKLYPHKVTISNER